MSFNQSYTNQTASCAVIDSSAHPFFMLVCGLVFLVGLVLNGFTLKVYFCHAERQSSSSSVMVYLKNLAIADFLLCLCLPLRISNYAYRHNITIRIIYCTIGATTFYLNIYVSILFMGYIAANRYLKIVQPSASNPLQKVCIARVISMVTWVSLLTPMGVYVSLHVHHSLLTSRLDNLTLTPEAVSCDALQTPQLSLLYKILHSFSAVIFVSVLVSLIYFYHGTVQRLTLAQRTQPGGGGAEGGGGGGASSLGTLRRCKKLSRCRRNMLVLVAVFCVCFVPYHLVRLPYAFLSHRCSLGQSFFYLKEFSLMLSILNICLDPLIYFIFCKDFRAQLGLRRKKSVVQDMTRVPTGVRMSQVCLTVTKVERKNSALTLRRTSIL